MESKHPKLWKFIKKINRGLALGLAIIIVMTVWLSVSAAKVKKETPELRAMTREYLIELIEVSALMNGDKVGEALSTATENAMKDALVGIVDKYYTDSKAAQRAYNGSASKKSGTMLIEEFSTWTKNASAVHLQSVEITESETVLNSGTVIYNYSFEPVLKAGKYLEVWFSFETDVVYDSTYPNEFRIYPFFMNGMYEYYEDRYDDKYGNDIEKNDGVIYRVNAKFNVTGRLTFVRENGEWKIACVQNLNAYLASQSMYEPLTKEVG